MNPLHVHRFGPDHPPDVLALHGLTGHGRRWERLARTLLPELAVLAPDLRGHGRSDWSPPWTLDAQVESLAALLDAEADGPVTVVGHSYGGTIAVRLARSVPRAVRALVLLDPAMGLDADRARTIADAYLHSPDYPDAAQARADKVHGGWADVPGEVLDADIAEHLVASPHGGVTWRVCAPAMVAAWGEMARRPVAPPPGTPTTLVRAQRVRPPFLPDEVLAGWRSDPRIDLAVREVGCEHMIPQSHPALVAELVRSAVGAGARP